MEQADLRRDGFLIAPADARRGIVVARLQDFGRSRIKLQESAGTVFRRRQQGQGDPQQHPAPGQGCYQLPAFGQDRQQRVQFKPLFLVWDRTGSRLWLPTGGRIALP